MDAVKTYDHISAGEQSLEIRIEALSKTHERSKGKPDKPHRHDFYTVLLVEKSKGTHLIDFKEYELGERQVFFVAPGQVHQVVEESSPLGFSILFSRAFLMRNRISEHFIQDLNLFHDYAYAPPIELEQSVMEKICAYANDMIALQNSSETFSDEAMGALLKLILIECHRSCKLPNDANLQSESGKGSILRNFKNLIDEHFKEWHGVQQYADKLHISTDHLNRVVKSQTGKTAKDHIQSKLTVEAKRQLYFSDMSSKEIGFFLGFSEPAHFSAFFKKNTGLSPSQYESAKS